MTTMSMKETDFLSEPIGVKENTALPGIGDNLGKKLEERGFGKVCKKIAN